MTTPAASSRFAGLLLVILASACASPAPVRIAIIVSTEAVAGARLAADEANAHGGIDGRALELTVMGGGGNTVAGLAIVNAESLAVDESIVAVVGHSNSAASLAASQTYNRRGIVQIAPTSSAPLLSQAGPWTFRMVGSDLHQARFLAEKIAAGPRNPRVAIFYVNDDYGHALHAELLAQLLTRGIEPVHHTPYVENIDLPNADAMARALLDSEPDLLVWLGRTRQFRQIIPVVRHALPNIRFLASDGIDNTTTAANVDSLLTGVQHACFVDLYAPTDSIRALQGRFIARGNLLNAEAVLTYDAVNTLITAMRAVGPDRTKVRDYLTGMGTTHPAHEGASGAVTFDSNGDANPNYCLATVRAPAAAP